MISIALSGQRDNSGDTLHRRVLLDYLRPLGELHVHLGDVPPSFVAGLRLDGTETLYTSSASWLLAAHREASPDSLLVFSPGEMRMGSSRARREMMLTPIIARVRRRGGRVVRLGVAAGSEWQLSSRFAEGILRSTIARTDVLAWREPFSQKLFGAGDLIQISVSVFRVRASRRLRWSGRSWSLRCGSIVPIRPPRGFELFVALLLAVTSRLWCRARWSETIRARSGWPVILVPTGFLGRTSATTGFTSATCVSCIKTLRSW